MQGDNDGGFVGEGKILLAFLDYPTYQTTDLNNLKKTPRRANNIMSFLIYLRSYYMR